METLLNSYQKYRWFYTASGKLVIGGKNAAQNDALIKELKQQPKDYLVMHTSSPGSPFAVILASPSSVTKRDCEECSVFTASFSREWRAEKKEATVDIFLLSALYKDASMPLGTWGTKEKLTRVVAPLKLIITKQKGIVRAVPEATLKKRTLSFAVLVPGKISKQDMPLKLNFELKDNLPSEEVLSALPSGSFRIIKEK